MRFVKSKPLLFASIFWISRATASRSSGCTSATYSAMVGALTTRLEAVDSEQLRGPVLETCRVEGPAPDVCESLTLGEVELGGAGSAQLGSKRFIHGSELPGDCLAFHHWRDLVSRAARGENIRDCRVFCPGDRRPGACFGAVCTDRRRTRADLRSSESLMLPSCFHSPPTNAIAKRRCARDSLSSGARRPATREPSTTRSSPQRRSLKASLPSRSKPRLCAAGGCDRPWPSTMA